MVVANVHTQSQAAGQTPTIRTIPVAVLGMSLSQTP